MCRLGAREEHITRVLTAVGRSGGSSGPFKVMVAPKAVDFRKGAVSLTMLVEHELGLGPFSGVTFIFHSKRANRINLLVWDGTGLVLVSNVLQTRGFH